MAAAGNVISGGPDYVKGNCYFYNATYKKAPDRPSYIGPISNLPGGWIIDEGGVVWQDYTGATTPYY